MKYTREQLRQMTQEFLKYFGEYGDTKTIEVLERLNEKGWPYQHSYANIKALAK